MRNSGGKFSLQKECDFEFDDAAISFYFNNDNTEEVFFFTMDEVFKFNYMEDGAEKETIYTLDNELNDPPKFGVFSPDQTKFIVTSSQDILYVDMKIKDLEMREIDFDDREEISAI
jgi:hypothetical protein